MKTIGAVSTFVILILEEIDILPLIFFSYSYMHEISWKLAISMNICSLGQFRFELMWVEKYSKKIPKPKTCSNTTF